MSGLEPLERYIYHEKQDKGSMLCAQHALNVLFQQGMYDATQLAAIAAELDEQEQGARYDDQDQGTTSTNMDDSGFFSVQVLSSALRVWGLSLERWRSEAMRAYQDHPQGQLAFIFNRSEHWYTLRRFGNANPDFTQEALGEAHWFNLDSMKDGPEWVSQTYLGLQLQTAESEGYSIFAIVQIDPEAPLALPRTRADEVASTLPQPTSVSSSSRARQHETIGGFEDEDMELQRVLAASLREGDDSTASHEPNPPSLRASHVPGAFVVDDEIDEDEATPPVGFDYRRFQREQQMAARDGYVDAQVQGAPVPDARAERRAREDAAEQEEIRRAIALSRGDGMDEDEVDDHIYVPPGVGGATAEASGARPPPPGDFRPSYPGHGGERMLDDEDAELQRALAASLGEGVEGYTPPEFTWHSPARPEPPVIRHADDLDALPSLPGFATRPRPPPAAVPVAPQHTTSNVEEDEGDASMVVEEKEPDLDEIRRKRLERLGGR